MDEMDIGQATIAYEDPDEGTVERTVQNEHVAYFQDHWIVKTDEREDGGDVVRRIPRQRVYYVERSVEEFEEEVKTVRDQVQSFAGDLRSRILGGESGEGAEGSEVHRIDVEKEAGESAEGGESEGSGGSGESGESAER